MDLGSILRGVGEVAASTFSKPPIVGGGLAFSALRRATYPPESTNAIHRTDRQDLVNEFVRAFTTKNSRFR